MVADQNSVTGTRAGTTTGTTTRDQIEALFARRQDAYDDLDAAALAEDYTDDAVIESPFSGTHGKEQAEQVLRAVFTAFMDLTTITEALLIDGDRVAQVARIEGSNLGGLFGVPASGKTFNIPVVIVYTLRDGKIAREQRVYDFTGWMVQVGVLKAKPAT